MDGERRTKEAGQGSFQRPTKTGRDRKFACSGYNPSAWRIETQHLPNLVVTNRHGYQRYTGGRGKRRAALKGDGAGRGAVALRGGREGQPASHTLSPLGTLLLSTPRQAWVCLKTSKARRNGLCSCPCTRRDNRHCFESPVGRADTLAKIPTAPPLRMRPRQRAAVCMARSCYG